MDPYNDLVVGAATKDNERARQMARLTDNDQIAAAKAFGNSRVGVVDALRDGLYDDNSARTTASLRSQGFNNAQAAATSDLNRRFQGDIANQGVDLSVEGQNAGLLQGINLANLGYVNQAGQFNAGQRQGADLANQGASISSAGVRTGAAGLLGDLGVKQQQIEQAGLDRQYQQYQAEQAYPLTMQQLVNQSLGLLPNPVLSSSTSTGNSSGSASRFDVSGPSSWFA